MTQDCAGKLHVVPQAPQLALSVCSSTQVPLQFVRPAWQLNVHFPLEQALPAGHAVPQLPQLAWSDCVFAQKGGPASGMHNA
jgi:hypothetical protein